MFVVLGGIEAEAVMMGLPMSMVIPAVVGYRITGELSQQATSTDVVLTITKVPQFINLCIGVQIQLNAYNSMNLCLIAFARCWSCRKICRILWSWSKQAINCRSCNYIKHVS